MRGEVSVGSQLAEAPETPWTRWIGGEVRGGSGGGGCGRHDRSRMDAAAVGRDGEDGDGDDMERKKYMMMDDAGSAALCSSPIQWETAGQ